MSLPNFFIVGAAKSGTTALYRYLRQHPDVYMPDVKEPRHFAYDPEDREPYGGPGAQDLIDSIVKDRAEYEALYADVNGERAVGDASPAYLTSPVAAGRIHDAVPGARIVAVLRNPVERAYSHFLDNVQSGWEPERDFERVLDLREMRARERWWRKWDYVGNGLYGEQLQRYFERFPPQRIRIYLHEDLQRDRPGVLRDLLGFLEVDPSAELDLSRRHNVSGVPRNALVASLVSGPNPARRLLKPLLPARLRTRIRADVERRNLHRPEMPAAARSRLIEVYREDVERVEALIGRSLASWRR
jgi:Sulfotransferase family